MELCLASLHCYYCSDPQSCPILCNSMDCRMPGLPVSHRLTEFAQVHAHCIGNGLDSGGSDGKESGSLQRVLSAG